MAKLLPAVAATDASARGLSPISGAVNPDVSDPTGSLVGHHPGTARRDGGERPAIFMLRNDRPEPTQSWHVWSRKYGVSEGN